MRLLSRANEPCLVCAWNTKEAASNKKSMLSWPKGKPGKDVEYVQEGRLEAAQREAEQVGVGHAGSFASEFLIWREFFPAVTWNASSSSTHDGAEALDDMPSMQLPRPSPCPPLARSGRVGPESREECKTGLTPSMSIPASA